MPLFLGTSADETISGTAGSDVIVGNAGNDTLDDGGGGPDELIGGTGNDTYIVTNAGDTAYELAGEGTDTVRTALAAYVLSANVENLVYTGSAVFVGRGNALDNVIAGGIGDDTLYGFDGRDTLIGGAGDDLLDGGTGLANQLEGGTGNDIYVVSAVGDTVTEFSGEGIDTVRTTLASYLIGPNIENLFYDGASDFIGSGNASDNVIIGRGGNDSLSGFGGSDYLIGGAGDDLLDGGSGAGNTLQGGTGNDTYIVSAIGDTVTEFSGEGIDTVRASTASFVLPSAVENLTYTGTGDFIGVGNTGDNTIIGAGGNDSLSGGSGRDILIGSAGDDTLSGGFGATNELYGGTGNDTYVVDAADTIIELPGEGIDRVITSLTNYTLPQNVENLSLSPGFATNRAAIGNELANTITGSYSNDYIDGGIGAADILIGLSGSDTYVVRSLNDVVIEDYDSGNIDVIYTALTNYTLPLNVEQLIYTGTANFIGTANPSNSLPGGISGGPGDDILTNSTRYGYTLSGGNGNDTYYISRSDNVVENPNEGIDTVYSSGSGRLAVFANVENFFWIGNSSLTLEIAGNALDNVIEVRGTITISESDPQRSATLSGYDGNDTLRGGGSGTRFLGGNGNDTLIGSTTLVRDDFVFVSGDSGIDRIVNFQSGTDKILITPGFYAGVALQDNVFSLDQGPGAVPTTTLKTFIYDTTSGLLSFDPDGTGARSATPLAYLDTGLHLSASDFLIA